MDGERMSLLSKNTYNSSSLKDIHIRMEFYQERLNYLNYLPLHIKYEINSCDLDKLKLLHEGHFSVVYLGLLTIKDSRVTVAVKTPKSFPCESESELSWSAITWDPQKLMRDSLRDELKIMTALPSHPNILQLLGACTVFKDDFCLITEYCEYGSLDGFLQSKYENEKFIDEIIVTGGDAEIEYQGQKDKRWLAGIVQRKENGQITTTDLLWFALQIVRGMTFLSENLVLHRDIALRNVLLTGNFTVKIGDFGLSRRTGDDGIYELNRTNTVLPVRFIAPETLKSGRFCSQSELWAFGVALWEIFTFARQHPYATECGESEDMLGNILNFLEAGQRLSMPKHAPKQIQDLICQLWQENPTMRPTFALCDQKLAQELEKACPSLQPTRTREKIRPVIQSAIAGPRRFFKKIRDILNSSGRSPEPLFQKLNKVKNVQTQLDLSNLEIPSTNQFTERQENTGHQQSTPEVLNALPTFNALEYQEKSLDDDNNVKVLIPCDTLMRNRIGGTFRSHVYVGYIETKTIAKRKVHVAIKTLASTRMTMEAGELTVQDAALRREIDILKCIGYHDNILHLIGTVTVSRNKFYMVTEYCEFGNLENFLRDKFEKKKFIDLIERSGNTKWDVKRFSMELVQQPANLMATKNSELTTLNLIVFGYQIASALEFTETKQFFCSGTSLLNIFLSSNYTVKITPSLLEKRRINDDHQEDNQETETKCPNMKFIFGQVSPQKIVIKLKSDLWSFGVLLWELFHLGTEPFRNVNSSDLRNFLEKRIPLEPPYYAPMEIYELMKMLWTDDSMNETSISEAKERLNNMLSLDTRLHKKFLG